jgi:hypothetical protein
VGGAGWAGGRERERERDLTALVHKATTAVGMQEKQAFVWHHPQHLLIGCSPKHLWEGKGGGGET